MDMIKNSVVILLLLGGLFFILVGTIGLYRLPDIFTRLHATNKSDTLGAGLIILSVMIYMGFDIIVLKLFLVLMFIWITNPTAAHIISKAVYHNDVINKEESNDA